MKKTLILFAFILAILTSSIQAQETNPEAPSYFPKGSLGLRTNTVSWVLLTPNLGIEYKVSDNLGLLVDGGWAHWNLKSRNRYWRVWNIEPQIRTYFGSDKNNYIGAQYTMGEYNLLGDQAKYMGGGLTLGHQFYCGKNLMVDLGLSLGYLYLHDKEKYERIDGHNYRTTSKSSHGYWGPTGLTVSFVWKIN